MSEFGAFWRLYLRNDSLASFDDIGNGSLCCTDFVLFCNKQVNFTERWCGLLMWIRRREIVRAQKLTSFIGNLPSLRRVDEAFRSGVCSYSGLPIRNLYWPFFTVHRHLPSLRKKIYAFTDPYLEQQYCRQYYCFWEKTKHLLFCRWFIYVQKRCIIVHWPNGHVSSLFFSQLWIDADVWFFPR